MQISNPRASLLSSLVHCFILAVTACGSSPNAPIDGSSGTPDGSADQPDAADPTPDAALPDAADPDPDAAIDAPPDAAIDAPPDAPDTTCETPFTVTPDPGAEAAATAALRALSPTATLDWSAPRGTFARINSLVMQLPDCTGSINAYDQMFAVLAQSPALFQIDRADWRTDSAVTCADILATGFHTLIIRRERYGQYPLQNDVFRVVADRQSGVVIFRNFSGVYLPPPSPAMLAKLDGCPDKSDAQLLAAARAEVFRYHTFAPFPEPFCSIDGEGKYGADAGDTVTLEPGSMLFWEEGDDIKLHRERTTTLVVAPANHTADLIRSDANCPDDENLPRIGWMRTFDSISGLVLRDRPTPDPFCTVCFK